MNYDELLFEDADKLLCFGNEYASVIAIENAAYDILPVNEVSYDRNIDDDDDDDDGINRGYGDTGVGHKKSITGEAKGRNKIKKEVESEVEGDKTNIEDTRKFNNAIKALTAAAAAVTGGAAATAANAVKNSDGGTGKVAGIVALASAVTTAAGAVGQHLHDKHRVQKLKADSIETLDDKLDDITVKLNTAGPGEKRDLLVARDALRKAKREIVKM